MSYRSVLLLATVAVVLICSVRQVAAQITCYTCNSDNSGTDVNGCGRLTSNVGTSSNTCSYCTLTVLGPGSYSRGCATTGTAYNQCNSGSGSSSCTCNTTNCNSQQLYWRGSTRCYVCNSADYLNNGCGSTLNAASQYVSIVGNCMACGLSISSASQDGGIYSRYCINSYAPASSCGGTAATCSYRCTGDLCNSAARLGSFTAAVGLLLAAASLLLTPFTHRQL